MRHTTAGLAALGLFAMLGSGCEGLFPASEPEVAAVAATADIAAPIAPSDRAGPAAPPGPSAAPSVPASHGTGSAGTKPFRFTPPEPAVAPAAACAFPGLGAAGAYKLFAAGAYSGRKLGFQIDETSGNESGQIDVAVNHRAAPVALMLGSYDPTVWNIGWTEGTDIVAVLVGGYHHQVVTGLPDTVPVIVSTYDNKGPCGYYYVTAEKAHTLNPVARRAFGRAIDMVFPAAQGSVVVGDPLAPGTELVTDASARPAAAFRVAESRAAGEAGLAYAVSRGWLREATRSDADAWLAAASKAPAADVPPIAGGRPPGRITMHNGYVVLAAFELPAGLYGAHSATFFVPKGVPRPTGKLGHSTLYDFNTLTCAGTLCGRD